MEFVAFLKLTIVGKPTNQGMRTRCLGVKSDADSVLWWVGADEHRTCGVGSSDMTADAAIAVGPGTLIENVPTHLVVTAILPEQWIATRFAAQH